MMGVVFSTHELREVHWVHVLQRNAVGVVSLLYRLCHCFTPAGLFPLVYYY